MFKNTLLLATALLTGVNAQINEAAYVTNQLSRLNSNTMSSYTFDTIDPTGTDCENIRWTHRHHTNATFSFPWSGASGTTKFHLFGTQDQHGDYTTGGTASNCANNDVLLEDLNKQLSHANCGAGRTFAHYRYKLIDTASGCPTSTSNGKISQSVLANALTDFIIMKRERQDRANTQYPIVIVLAGIVEGTLIQSLEDALTLAEINNIFIFAPSGDYQTSTQICAANTFHKHPAVFSVGAITDRYASAIGVGDCVDLYAHGHYTNPTTYGALSDGTAKATMVTAMHAAHLLDSRFGRTLKPAELYSYLRETSHIGVVTGQSTLRVLAYYIPFIFPGTEKDGFMTMRKKLNVKQDMIDRGVQKIYPSATLTSYNSGLTYTYTSTYNFDDSQCTRYRSFVNSQGWDLPNELTSKARLVMLLGDVKRAAVTNSPTLVYERFTDTVGTADGTDQEIHDMLVNDYAVYNSTTGSMIKANSCRILGGLTSGTKRYFYTVNSNPASFNRAAFVGAVKKAIDERLSDTVPFIMTIHHPFVMDSKIRCLLQEARRAGIFIIGNYKPTDGASSIEAFDSSPVMISVSNSANYDPANANSKLIDLYVPGINSTSTSNRYPLVQAALYALEILSGTPRVSPPTPETIAQYMLFTASTVTVTGGSYKKLNRPDPATVTGNWKAQARNEKPHDAECWKKPYSDSYAVAKKANRASVFDTLTPPASNEFGLSHTNIANGATDQKDLCKAFRNAFAPHWADSAKALRFPLVTVPSTKKIALFIIDSGVETTYKDVEYYDHTSEGPKDFVYHGEIMQRILIDKKCGAIQGDLANFRVFVEKACNKERKCQTKHIHKAIANSIDNFDALGAGWQGVVSFSGIMNTVNTAIECSIKMATSTRNMHFVVAAGNTGEDSCTKTPARSAAAITVGGLDVSSNLYKSNTGTCVDVYANAIFSYNWKPELATLYGRTYDVGTSLATTIVAAQVVNILANSGTSTYTPAQVRNIIINSAITGKVKGISLTNTATSPNRMLKMAFSGYSTSTPAVNNAKTVSGCTAFPALSTDSALDGEIVTDIPDPESLGTNLPPGIDTTTYDDGTGTGY